MADQTIQNFFTHAIDRDFSRDFLFRVVDINFGPGGYKLTEQELLYAKTATLPERAIVNHSVKYRGLDFQVPGSVTYGGATNYSIDFYCDSSSDLRYSLLLESRRVFDDQTTTGDYNIPTRGATITLQQLNKRLEGVMEFTLFGASIRTVGSINYDMAGGTGAVMSFPCNIAYHYFTEVGLGAGAFNDIGRS